MYYLTFIFFLMPIKSHLIQRKVRLHLTPYPWDNRAVRWAENISFREFELILN